MAPMTLARISSRRDMSKPPDAGVLGSSAVSGRSGLDSGVGAADAPGSDELPGDEGTSELPGDEGTIDAPGDDGADVAPAEGGAEVGLDEGVVVGLMTGGEFVG